jgi:hypothetical protein
MILNQYFLIDERYLQLHEVRNFSEVSIVCKSKQQLQTKHIVNTIKYEDLGLCFLIIYKTSQLISLNAFPSPFKITILRLQNPRTRDVH